MRKPPGSGDVIWPTTNSLRTASTLSFPPRDWLLSIFYFFFFVLSFPFPISFISLVSLEWLEGRWRHSLIFLLR